MTDRPRTEPRERNRYEHAVAMAWSAGAALEIRAISEVVMPEPLKRPLFRKGG